MIDSLLALLQVRDVSLAFGGLRVLDGLTFTVGAGEIVTLIGPSGAGKTMVLNAISGLCRPSAGTILFEGRRLDGLSPDQIARCGIARTFQSPRISPNLTVLENVMAAAYGDVRTGFMQALFRSPAFREEEERIRAHAEAALAMVGSRPRGLGHDRPAYTLSSANRRGLEIARALVTDPKLLLLDEPAAGLNPYETDELAELIQGLRAEGGYAILLAEHDRALAARVTDRAIALEEGRAVAEGSVQRACLASGRGRGGALRSGLRC